MLGYTKLQEQQQPLGIEYQHASIIDISYNYYSFDIVLGIFVFNYLTLEEMQTTFTKIFHLHNEL